ncbi:MAG: VWA domain-containing protein [Acidobacteriaceae bacterium]|nr:VWA domain-containing protein [Acidobacteriaceae bacterium]MBV9780349.1 VWA domain-containing protein [Acidobacteriaceae bacterium]
MNIYAGWCIALSLSPCLFAQTAPSAKSDNARTPQTTFKAGSEEVVLDVIVRDKKGQPVKDLKPDDLEVYDNGAKRPITSFRLIEGAAAIVGGQQTPGAQPQHLDPLRQVRLITLLFAHLGDVNSRRLSRTAAFDLLKTDLPQNVYMSVLVLDQSIEALQAFTNDRDRLRRAVEKATGGSYSQFHAESEQVQAQLQQMLGPATAGESPQEQIINLQPGAGTGPAAATAAQGSATVQMAQMMLNMLQLAQTSEMAQSGRVFVYGLLDAIRQQYMLPGRKSVFLFTEGFAVPQGAEEAFRTVISTANRFNVSFYSIDARGLNSTNLNDASLTELRNAAAASRAQFGHNSGPVNPQKAKEFDTAIDAGKANTQNTLAELAGSTGGFLIANTNDFRGPLQRAVDDIETYYEITYNPGIQKYDGSFRTVQIKSERPSLRIQSRAGYFALPNAATQGGAVLAPYELPLLKALSVKPPPRDFDFRAAGLHFRSAKESTCSVIIDLPFSSILFQPSEPVDPPKEKNKSESRLKADFAYVVLIKDSNGEIVRNFRGDVPLQPAASQMDALRMSHFVLKENFGLPPGRYTLETAMLDRGADKTSVRRSVLIMPPIASPLGISSVSIVRDVREKQETTDPGDPFLMGTNVITPTLASLDKNSLAQGLSFYLVIYTDKANQGKPQLTMEFKRDGQPVGAGSPPLGEPDEQGRVQYLGTAASDNLQPGNYEVRFIARQGNEAAAESVTFTLE